MNRVLAFLLAFVVGGSFGAYNVHGANEVVNTTAEWTDERSVSGELQIGNGDNSIGSLTLSGDAKVSVSGNLRVSNGKNSQGELLLKDNAEISVSGNTFHVCRYNNSKALVAITDNAKLNLLHAQGYVYMGGGEGNEAAESRFVQEGGTIEGATWDLSQNGTNSVAELKGGVSTFKNWSLCTSDSPKGKATTNAIVVSGGEHRILSAIKMQGWDSAARLTISGGKAILAESGAFYLGGDNGSHLLELLGGEFHLPKITAGASGRAYANGGTIVPVGKDDTTIRTIPSFILGPQGLTFRSDIAGSVSQAFADAEGENGKFVKVGHETLKCWTASSHAVTEVNEGTLYIYGGIQFGRRVVVQNGGAVRVVENKTFTAPNFVYGGEDGSKGELLFDGGAKIATENLVVNSGTFVVDAQKSVSRSIAVKNGASVSIAVPLVLEALTLGGADGSLGVLKIADGVTMDVGALTINRAGVEVKEGETEYVLLTTTDTVSAADLGKIEVLNPVVSKVYAFTSRANAESGKNEIVVTVSDLETTSATWSGGTSGDWQDADNWGGVIPDGTAVIAFGADSVNKGVTLVDDVAACGLVFDAGYTLGGASIALKGTVKANAGVTTVGSDVTVDGMLVFDVAAGATLVLNGAVTAAANIRKIGAGRLVVNGEVVGVSLNWQLDAGVIEVGGASGLGAVDTVESTITLKSGTLRFNAGAETAIGHVVRINAPKSNDRVILSTDRDLVLGGGVDSLSGTFIKIGSGNVLSEYGTGAFKLGTQSAAWNASQAGVTSRLPDDGSSPVAEEGKVTFLEVLDGVLKIRGNGPAKTTIKQNQPLYIGTAWTGAVVQAGMELDAVNYSQGGASQQLVIGIGAKDGILNHPYLSVYNSTLLANTIAVGGNTGSEIYPELRVSNSTVTATWGMNVGYGGRSKIYSKLLLGEGADVSVYRADGGSSEGVCFFSNVGGVVSNGAVFASRANGNTGSNKGMILKGASSGRLSFVNGGVLETYKFTNEDASGTLAFAFDGGILKLTGSSLEAATGFTLVSEGKGMEVRVAEELTHEFATPFTGDGQVVKTGAGRLVLTSANDEPVGKCTGGMVVKEGVLEVSGGALAENVDVNVVAGATLDLGGDTATATMVDGVYGAGTVVNGLLAGAIKVDVDSASVDSLITLGEGVSVQNAGFKVKFVYEDEANIKKSGIPVCRLGEGVAVDCSVWKGVGLPEGLGAEFSVKDGIVSATIKSVGGTMIILR